MKKLILAVAALAVAVIGFGGFHASTTYAAPSKIWVVNGNVAATIASTPVTPAAFETALMTSDVTRAPYLSQLDDFQTASGMQVAVDAAIPFAGTTFIIVQTDGSTSPDEKLDGRGLTCVPVACDGAAVATPDATDHINVYKVTSVGTHTPSDAPFILTVVQGGASPVSIDSGEVTIVGQARNLALTVLKPTIQEGLSACELTDSISAPTRSGAIAVYTDINDTPLVGYLTTWASSSSDMLSASVSPGYTPSMLQADGKTVAAGDVICGVTAGTAKLKASNKDSGAILGETTVTRSADVTITGVPASIDATPNPAQITCDGNTSSTVTAKVTDSAGNNVVDNTPVIFNVVALGTANPINVKTKDGEASSVITPLSAQMAGVTVIVQAGDVQKAVRIDCSLPVPTVAPPAPTATPGTGITGPSTGTGGFLGQDDSAGFPMWTLVALVLGSLVLVGGGMVTRRTGK